MAPELDNPFEGDKAILGGSHNLVEDEKEPSLDDVFVCTVVSLIPLDLHEEKPQLLPGSFHIPAAPDGDISILHVRQSIHWVPNPLVEEGLPGSSFEVVTPPNEMARSICDDYRAAHIALGPNAQPGIFWVPGKLTKRQIKEKYTKKLANAREQQLNWFRNLVALADADYNKNRNMLAVSDLQRAAARILGIRKDWVNPRVEESRACPFCTSAIPTAAIVCPNCKQVLDKDEFARMGGV